MSSQTARLLPISDPEKMPGAILLVPVGDSDQPNGSTCQQTNSKQHAQEEGTEPGVTDHRMSVTDDFAAFQFWNDFFFDESSVGKLEFLELPDLTDFNPGSESSWHQS